MKTSKKLTSLILIACMLAGLLLCSCTQKKTSSKAKTIPTQHATITESGWSFDTETATLYYAVTVKNESTKYLCTGAFIDIVITTSGGNKIDDSFDTPVIAPNSSVTVAASSTAVSVKPENVSFALSVSTSWEENEDNLKPLEITNCGTRYPEFSYDDSWDIDEDLASIFEGEDMSGYSQGEYTASGLIEFYGTIMNPNTTAVDGAIVYIIYRDGAGGLLGGESVMITDVIAQGGTVDFSFLAAAQISYSSFEAHAYVW